MADPDFETTANVPVRIAGIDGLQIDGVVTAQSVLEEATSIVESLEFRTG